MVIFKLLPRRKDEERERWSERGRKRERELTNSRRKQKDESSYAGLLCLSTNTKTNSSPVDFHEIPPASKQAREVNISDKFQSMNEAAHTLIPANFSHFPVELLVCECAGLHPIYSDAKKRHPLVYIHYWGTVIITW